LIDIFSTKYNIYNKPVYEYKYVKTRGRSFCLQQTDMIEGVNQRGKKGWSKRKEILFLRWSNNCYCTQRPNI